MASPVRYPAPLRFGDSSSYASNFTSFVFSLAHYILSGALTPKIFKAFCKTILIAFIRKSLAAVN